MTKFWNWLKAFIDNRDFGDAVKSVADDFKVAAGFLAGLGALSLASQLPAPMVTILVSFGMHPVPVSTWVSWVLFGVAGALYAVQFWLRVSKRKKDMRKARVQQQQEAKNDNPPGRSTSAQCSCGADLASRASAPKSSGKPPKPRR